jgi:putative peptidoglycan lipid II flippase
MDNNFLYSKEGDVSRLGSEGGNVRSFEVERSAAVVGGATLVSRLLGLLRDMVLAAVLGASMPADAFFAAFRIPNFLRRIFAEGSLTSAFVPVFTDVQAKEGPDAALRVACQTLNWLILILICISAAGVVFAPQIIHVLTPGWIEDYGKFSLTVDLTRVMFPYIFWVSLLALATGILNSRGHFWGPAFAPAVFNVCLISSALAASVLTDMPVRWVAVGVLAGGFIQVLMQLPPLLKRGFRYMWVLGLTDPHLRRLGRLLVPSLLGSAVYQINMIVITVLASLLPHGSLSYLYYADRLAQFPLGVFAIAMGTALLPAMSRRVAEGDMEGLSRTFERAFRQVALVMIPSSVGLIALRRPIISLIFQRGRFDEVAAMMSAEALLCYAVGLWFVAEIRVVAPVFFALKDTSTPMKVAALSIGVNLLLSVILMGPLGHSGLALALSLSAMAQLLILMERLSRRLKGMVGWRLFRPMPAVVAASSIMGVGCWLAAGLIPWMDASNPPALRVAMLLGVVSAGVALYVVLVRAFGVREAQEAWWVLTQRLRTLNRAGSVNGGKLK